MSYPVIARGSKIGIHTIRPNQALPLVRAAKEHGVTWPLVKAVDNAGVALDVKAVSPQTITIVRFVNDKWDAAQDVQQWTAETRERAARETVQLVFERTNRAERQATDYFEPLNEADPPGEAGWRAFGLFLCEVVREADRRGVRLALPAFNAGTPEWGEMQALVETGVFGMMKAGGHILTVHEGVFGSDMPVEAGFGDLIPGAPAVPGAGSLCRRYRYLYHLLQQRDEAVPLVISEFYGGGGYSAPPEEHVRRLGWYDRLVREDWYVLAFLPFTIDPNPGWQHSDYTYAYPAVLAYLERERDGENGLPPTVIPVQPPVPEPPRPTPEPPVPAGTHRVTATQLNVRAHPWTGSTVPPQVRMLKQGEVVSVLGVYQPASLPHGWGCLSTEGNEWISMQYVERLS